MSGTLKHFQLFLFGRQRCVTHDPPRPVSDIGRRSKYDVASTLPKGIEEKFAIFQTYGFVTLNAHHAERKCLFETAFKCAYHLAYRKSAVLYRNQEHVTFVITLSHPHGLTAAAEFLFAAKVETGWVIIIKTCEAKPALGIILIISLNGCNQSIRTEE